MNHAAALFDSAIRFNSLLGMPSMTGKTVEGRPEQKSFLKALDSALDAGLDDGGVMSPLSAALGGEEKARDFLKAHVKAHTRIVDGKVVQVKEHETGSSKQVVDRHTNPGKLAEHAHAIAKLPFIGQASVSHPAGKAALASHTAANGTVADHTAAGEAHAEAANWHQKMLDDNKGDFPAENKVHMERMAQHHDLAHAHFSRTWDEEKTAKHEEAAKAIRNGDHQKAAAPSKD
jgi:hypothetical protein